jgi:hypothetical protein
VRTITDRASLCGGREFSRENFGAKDVILYLFLASDRGVHQNLKQEGGCDEVSHPQAAKRYGNEAVVKRKTAWCHFQAARRPIC